MNTFLPLSKKAKIDNSQALDMLYEKLSNEFKDWLVIIKKIENLNDLILLLRNININMKKISKRSQICTKPNVSNFPATKPPFKSYNSAPTKPSTAVEVAVISPISSTAVGIHPGLIDVSNMIRREPILQEEKNRCNSLSLCCYYGEPGHIVINHQNHVLLATKRQVVSILMKNLIALVPYKSLPMEKKKTSLG